MPHRIVIVGGGAGGLELATRLGRSLGKRGAADIVLIDCNLTHLWKPLLHEVAAGSLSSSNNELNYIAQAKWNNFTFQLGRMSGLDREARQVLLGPELDETGAELIPARSIAYDTLIIAVGSTTNDFGTRGASENCIYLDTRAQAERFHSLLLKHYLSAHASPNDDLQQISVAVVGGGATGVELCAELRNAAIELAAYGLSQIKSENMRITLIEAGPRVLPALPRRVSARVLQKLEKLGVNVLVNSAVSEVTADRLVTDEGQSIHASLKVWAAGIRAPAFLENIAGLETNRLKQLQVKPTLQTTRDDDIFAFGDCAACPQSGRPGEATRNVPPRAQAAHQQASMLVRSLTLRVKGNGQKLPEFKFKDLGSLVSLSRFSAVGNLMGDVKIEGWLAQIFYASLYRMHQVALYGFLHTAMLVLGSWCGKRTEPRLKLH